MKRKQSAFIRPVGMASLKELFRIGKGPSSSHTMGPEAAAKLFAAKNPDATRFKVVLYGSLAMTGQGHGTDKVLISTLKKPTEVVFDKTAKNLPHPNTLDLFAYDNYGNEQAKLTVMSVGGGAIKILGEPDTAAPPTVYPLSTFATIGAYCKKNKLRLSDYVLECEGEDIQTYLLKVWDTMKASVERGLKATGTLPGGLGVQRKAKYLYENKHTDAVTDSINNRNVCAYAFAVAEENAGGGTICTAPTCGACGVVPAVLYHLQKEFGYTDTQIARALMAGGIVGNIIKTNASISGAECGCQAEIGSATSMAAAAIGELTGLDIDQIEYAAEIAMEHQLGLTCDPVGGLVQIPCIERNAVAAMRAATSVDLAEYLSTSRKVSFDTVVETMYRTGKDLNRNYRETSTGGLARTMKRGGKRHSRRHRYVKGERRFGRKNAPSNDDNQR